MKNNAQPQRRGGRSCPFFSSIAGKRQSHYGTHTLFMRTFFEPLFSFWTATRYWPPAPRRQTAACRAREEEGRNDAAIGFLRLVGCRDERSDGSDGLCGWSFAALAPTLSSYPCADPVDRFFSPSLSRSPSPHHQATVACWRLLTNARHRRGETPLPSPRRGLAFCSRSIIPSTTSAPTTAGRVGYARSKPPLYVARRRCPTSSTTTASRALNSCCRTRSLRAAVLQ